MAADGGTELIDSTDRGLFSRHFASSSQLRSPTGRLYSEAMLSVSEFNAAAERHLRRVMRVLLLLIGLPLGLAITFMWFVDPRAHIHPKCPAWLVPCGLIGVCIVILLVAAWPLNRWARRDSRLVCPHCGRGLFRARCRVAGTRRCPRCAWDILIDPEDPRPAPLNREKAEALAARFRCALRTIILFFVGVVLILVTVGIGCDALVATGWMNHDVSEGIAVVMTVLLGSGWGWCGIQVFRLPSTFVHCPRCRYDHLPGQALQLGCCRACGQSLIAGPSTVGVAEESPRG